MILVFFGKLNELQPSLMRYQFVGSSAGWFSSGKSF